MLPFPEIHPVAFSIPLFGYGELPIRWYALAYIAGFLLGSWLLARLVQRHPVPNFTKDKVDVLFIYVVLGVILGGRLGFVLFYNLPYYLAHPQEILMTWQGGMSFHGGLLGVILAGWVFCWRHRVHWLDVGDKLAAVVPIGIFFGRIANFINGELWGRPTDRPWAMVFPHDPLQLPRHPSQLYEAFWEGIVLFSILWVFTRYQEKLGLKRGFLTGMFLFFYGVFRFFIEKLREPDHFAYLGTEWLTTGQLLCVPMLVLGAGLMLYAQRPRR